jgi:hypothetical protein
MKNDNLSLFLNKLKLCAIFFKHDYPITQYISNIFSESSLFIFMITLFIINVYWDSLCF